MVVGRSIGLFLLAAITGCGAQTSSTNERDASLTDASSRQPPPMYDACFCGTMPLGALLVRVPCAPAKEQPRWRITGACQGEGTTPNLILTPNEAGDCTATLEFPDASYTVHDRFFANPQACCGPPLLPTCLEITLPYECADAGLDVASFGWGDGGCD
jgi:hypothetical protein